jgi:CubicO group peptidase (beta-lactamase class C family)
MSVWKWLGVACALFGAAPSWSVPYAPAPLSARIESYVQASMAEGATPGVVWVFQGGVPLYEGYHGALDRRSGVSLQDDTLFDIGSLTKSFTAAAVLRLVEQGVVALDDPLARYFPEAPDDKAGITIHQLLTHSSGVSDETGAFEGRDSDPYLSDADFLAPLWASPLNRSPGRGYEYSNAGYSLLAMVIERATGEGYETALRRLVLEPAGLTQTGYRLMNWSARNAARGYDDFHADPDRADRGLFYLERWRNEPVSYRLLGNGGLHSTPADMRRWMMALTAGDVLNADSLALLQAPLMEVDDPYPPSFTHYSYGWGVGARPSGEPWMSHAGSNGVFFVSVQYGPRSDTLILHMTNAARGSVGRMGYEIASMMDDPRYVPDPVHGGPVRLVLAFTAAHAPERINQLPDYLASRLGGSAPAPWVLNRTGLHQIKRGQGAWGLALLELNAELYPGNGNLHDSLAYAYEQTGRHDLALRHYRQALTLGLGEEDCYWCSNTQEALDRLASSE